MWCGNREAVVFPVTVVPDFDPSQLDPHLRARFLRKQNGLCTVCGLYQDFDRLTPGDIQKLSAIGKDRLTTDSAYLSYPPPAEAVREFNRRHFQRRLVRWSEYFDHRIKIERALFLRVWFGAAPMFVAARCGAQVSGLDMSPLCLRYTKEHVAGFRALDGIIDGTLEGPFLDTGPYDAIFTFHVLNHSCDVMDSLRKLRRLTRPGGMVVFTNEVERKPQNPFHNFHASEWQLRSVLRDVFERIDRIDDCEDDFVPHSNPFTARRDIPDFVAHVVR